MYITDIKKLRNGRYGLFAGEKFLVSLNEETLLLSGLKADTEIDDEEFEELVGRENRQRAKEKAMLLLSYRDHSRQELKRKIARTAGEEAAQEAADEMEELGLVNDAAFAENFARELYSRRLWGTARVRRELAMRGISRELIDEAIDNIGADEQEIIRRYLSKKYPRGITDDRQKSRAVSGLMRNGFAWDDIRQVIAACRDDFED